MTHVERGRVRADTVQQRLPWLYKLYRNEFLELAAEAWGEPIDTAYRRPVRRRPQRTARQEHAVRVPRRFESGNRASLLHGPSGRRGELIVSHETDAVGVAGLERDCTVIRPEAGQLIFFDGKTYPHYARELRSESDVRVVAVMNYYTRTCPESTRPAELNRHLFGDSLGPQVAAG